MMSFVPPWRQRIGVIAGLIALMAEPGIALGQQAQDDLEGRELALIDALSHAEEEYGPLSAQMIDPLTQLSLFYEESGNRRLSEPTINQLRSVIRANYGLYTLEQADAIRLLMSYELERENAAAAWDYEQELIELGLRNPDDVRTARIYHDVGDRRLDILKRYDDGDLPPEIELGCYYNDPNEYLRVNKRGNQPLSSAPGRQMGNGCSAGSRSDAKRALASQAHAFLLASLQILQDKDLAGGAEAEAIFATLLRSSYQNDQRATGRNVLRRLIDVRPENSLSHIEAWIQLADWDLLYSYRTGRRYRDAALTGYEDAYRMLVDNNVDRATVDALFAESGLVVDRWVEDELGFYALVLGRTG